MARGSSQDPPWSPQRALGDLCRHEAAGAGGDPAAATWRRAEGDARQEGHRSGTLTRSARSANSTNDAARGCPAMMRSRVGSKYPMRMDIAFSAPSWRLLFITLLGGAATAWAHSSK